jgi:hypothetical protein
VEQLTPEYTLDDGANDQEPVFSRQVAEEESDEDEVEIRDQETEDRKSHDNCTTVPIGVLGSEYEIKSPIKLNKLLTGVQSPVVTALSIPAEVAITGKVRAYWI